VKFSASGSRSPIAHVDILKSGFPGRNHAIFSFRAGEKHDPAFRFPLDAPWIPGLHTILPIFQPATDEEARRNHPPEQTKTVTPRVHSPLHTGGEMAMLFLMKPPFRHAAGSREFHLPEAGRNG
jgi:hypothetical protein